ncbi:hypothetical protein ACWCQN_38465 [Streptomyces sp. NPDC001984]
MISPGPGARPTKPEREVGHAMMAADSALRKSVCEGAQLRRGVHHLRRTLLDPRPPNRSQDHNGRTIRNVRHVFTTTPGQPWWSLPVRPGERAYGREAADLLFDRLDGERGPARHRVLATRYLARGSGELPAAEDS